MPRPIRRLLALAVLSLALPVQAAPEADGFMRLLAQRINEYRAQHDLGPLTVVDDLSLLAAEHSDDMALRLQLSHDGFRARMRRTHSPLCVENVAHNFPTVETLLDGWRRSPGHHRNLLEPKVSRMGLAATSRYVTFFACR